MGIIYGAAMKIWLPWCGMISLCISSPLFIFLKSIDEPHTVQHHSARGAQCVYQEFMGGVDLADQIQQSFTMIYYGLEACLLNSFTIWKKVRQTPQDSLHLGLLLCAIWEGKCFHVQPGRPPTRPADDVDAARRVNREYHSIHVEEDRRDCAVCVKVVSVQNLGRNLRYQTNTVCVICNHKPP